MRTNEERRNAGYAALKAHQIGEYTSKATALSDLKLDPESALSDLLCNLMHWAQGSGVSFREALKSGQLNYNAEKGPCSECKGPDHSEEECPNV